jgi:CubicO group peptidase (beta-lactamase class C family)
LKKHDPTTVHGRPFPALAIVVALATWVAPGPALAQSGDLPVTTVVAGGVPAAVDSARILVREAARQGVGIGVAVMRAGEAVWVEGVGWADDGETPVDPTGTRFRIYSVAKPMTAVAAGRLMERRALDPNASVRSYVPAFPAHDPPITTMQLATHTSGIRHYAGVAEAASTRHCQAVADALPIFADDPLVHDPGASETYSSWGYVLLSAVIEAVADTGFVAAMDKLVFGPAGMEGITLDDPTTEVPGRARFYTETDGSVNPADAVDNTCKWGAGGFVATAWDVAAFGAAMIDGSLLSEQTLELFFRGRDTYQAQGVGTGGAAFLVVDRAHDLVVALTANAIGERAGPAAQYAFNEIHRLFATP